MKNKKLIPSIFGNWILQKYPNRAIKEIAYSLNMARSTFDRWLVWDPNKKSQNQINQMINKIYIKTGQLPEQTRNELNKMIRNS